jgi:DNA processing protein
MTVDSETVALVALLRGGRRTHHEYVRLVEHAGSARAVFDRELEGDGDGAQTALFAADAKPRLETAAAETRAWQAEGIELVTVLDASYPIRLREVEDRPALVFIVGRTAPADERALAVIGARRASCDGLRLAAGFASEFVRAGYTVLSGLAAGIDTAAHRAALAIGGRTVAVIGTGLHHSYPAQNADLQRRIATECAVISQFWPDTPPTAQSFPLRNAVMSGLSRGSVVIEASPRSGARTQARLALAHGRPVFLHARLLDQPWARDLARRPGVHVVRSPADVCRVIEHSDEATPTATSDFTVTKREPPTRSPTPTSWRR